VHILLGDKLTNTIVNLHHPEDIQWKILKSDTPYHIVVMAAVGVAVVHQMVWVAWRHPTQNSNYTPAPMQHPMGVVMGVMWKTCGGIHKQKTPHVGALVAKTLHMNVPATRRCHTAVVVAVGDAHVLPPTIVKPWGHGVMPIAPMVAMVHRAVPANQTPVTLKYIK
jgi:hypothetical protein